MISFAWTDPDVPGERRMFMLEALTFRAAVRGNISHDKIEVNVWTNLFHERNPEGQWASVPLLYQETFTDEADNMVHVFANSVILTSHGHFRLTFRAREKNWQLTGNYTDWIWADNFRVDNIVSVAPPTNDKWTQGPEYTPILNNIYLGNFMAASVADKLGFNAVLNVADNLDLLVSKFKTRVNYKKIPLRDGASNSIPMRMLSDAVLWLQRQDKDGKKTLVNCRAGIGRAGSVVLAFVYSTRRDMSYEQAYDHVFSKHFIYPHKGLKESLERLYPRQPLEAGDTVF